MHHRSKGFLEKASYFPFDTYFSNYFRSFLLSFQTLISFLILFFLNIGTAEWESWEGESVNRANLNS